jgi:RNA polymerase sigma-70 factor (ECF subfamily)
MRSVTTDVDADVRAFLAASNVNAATELALRAYGPELIGWLCAVLPNDADAYDAFSYASEMLWRSLAQFESRCSVRAWCYMLARQSIARIKTRVSREELVASVGELEVAVSDVWSSTRRAQAREDDVYAQIRKSLDEEDEMLLILRVDRDLPWREIALVLDGKLEPEDDLVRRTANLRKQFERIKVRLRELAASELRD